MARRGFFAELQHQAEIAARKNAQKAQEAARAEIYAARNAEQARIIEERTAAQLARASAADQKRLAKEAQEAHVKAMETEVDKLNSELSEIYQAIDTLLSATLNTDPYVDLTTLYEVADHPPFDRKDLETPILPPVLTPDPSEPVFAQPPPPKGLAGLFGKKKHEEAVAAASLRHQTALADWRNAVKEAESAREVAKNKHTEMEKERNAALEAERKRYAAECAAREAAVKERNAAIDMLGANLGYGTVDAIEEYVSIVFSHSVYPAQFPIEHDVEFDPTTAELRLRLLVPSPDMVPTTSTYKYTKSADEITATALPQKAYKQRYNSVVQQVALRSMYEVFKADRRGLIRTIALEVGTETIDPATGRDANFLFVAVGAERDSFLNLDLAKVIPSETLSHLGAAVSKSPYDLITSDAKGIRRS